MILFAILLIMLLAIIVLGLLASIIGCSLITLFGDVIVFGLIVWLIIKIFRRKQK